MNFVFLGSSASILHSNHIVYKKTFQLKANRQLGNRYIGWVLSDKFEQIHVVVGSLSGHTGTSPANKQTDMSENTALPLCMQPLKNSSINKFSWFSFQNEKCRNILYSGRVTLSCSFYVACLTILAGGGRVGALGRYFKCFRLLLLWGKL